ncbi:MAG: hypothetical protein ACPGR8_17585 [Limisphaerales bacterium]
MLRQTNVGSAHPCERGGSADGSRPDGTLQNGATSADATADGLHTAARCDDEAILTPVSGS